MDVILLKILLGLITVCAPPCAQLDTVRLACDGTGIAVYGVYRFSLTDDYQRYNEGRNNKQTATFPFWSVLSDIGVAVQYRLNLGRVEVELVYEDQGFAHRFSGLAVWQMVSAW